MLPRGASGRRSARVFAPQKSAEGVSGTLVSACERRLAYSVGIRISAAAEPMIASMPGDPSVSPNSDRMKEQR